MSERVMEVTDATFEKEVLQSSLPVLVDFWAGWCQPCRTIGPIVEEIASLYEDRLRVAKMNVDDNENTPSQYGIRGIPALLLFRGGIKIADMVGAVPRAQLVKWLDQVLGS